MVRILFWCGGLVLVCLGGLSPVYGQPDDAIIRDYTTAVVSEPPDRLELDPFYAKYTDAQGIPVVGSADVPDDALLVARDIVLHMLSSQPDIQQYMVQEGYRVGVMAATDSTMDLPEHRDWEKPSIDDPRLTDEERGNYDRIAEMTAEEYWNQRARGMGGRYTTCAEENILGYPGTRYYGENILVHEFSHALHQAIKEVKPALAKEIEDAYQHAMSSGLWEGHYASTTVDEYWAEGTQFWFNSNYAYEAEDHSVLTPADLRQYDPDLYTILETFYKFNHHIPVDVYYEHEARMQ